MSVGGVFGLIASIVELARATADAAGFLQSRFPEYGRFFKKFERRLIRDNDVPWQAIRHGSYLQPDFIGWAVGLVHGDEASRTLLHAHTEKIVRREVQDAALVDDVLARVWFAADEAAVDAAGTDRAAGAAGRRLLEARLEGIRDAMSEQTAELKVVLAEQDAASEKRHEETIARLDKLARPPASAAGPHLDEDRLQALLDANALRIEQTTEELLDAYVQRPAQHRSPDPSPAPEATPKPVAATPPSEAVVAPTSPPLDRELQARADRRVERWVKELRSEAPQEAGRFEQILEDRGIEGLAQGLASGQFKSRSLAFLVAVGRTLGGESRLKEAKEAHLLGAQLAPDDHARARQFVRAAQLARASGEIEESESLLQQARDLEPDHPALILAEARNAADPKETLARLGNLEGENSIERAHIHQTRGQAHLVLGDLATARTELQLALGTGPEDPDDVVLELKALVPWVEAQQAVSNGEEPDRAALLEAAQQLYELGASSRTSGRRDETAHILARAAEVYMLGGAHDKAAQVAAEAAEADGLSLPTVHAVAEALLATNQPARALQVLPPDADDEQSRLFRAEGELATTADEPAIAELRSLMTSEDDEVARRAAFVLAAGAASDPDIPWDEEAASLIAQQSPHIARGLLAERYQALGDLRAAEATMLPNAGTVSALRRLRDYAAELGEWEKVKDRSTELIRRANDPRDRLALADALLHLGATHDAERLLLDVARDPSVAPDAREKAFSVAAGVVGDNRDYTRILELSEEWRRALPDSPNAIWNNVFALARLSRHAEALRILRDTGAQPESEQRATVMAEILHRAAEPEVAVRELLKLSKRFDRKVEALEAMVFATAVGSEQEGITLPADLEEEVRETVRLFPERFPESTAIRALPAPKSAEEWEELVAEMVGDGPKLQKELSQQIVNGQAPVNALAAAAGKTVGATWGRLAAMPLNVGPGASFDADKQAALDALGSAAVLDPSSVHVLGLLDAATEKAVIRVLPGSMLAQESLDDADSDTGPMAGRGSSETIHDDEGRWGVREIPLHERQEERRRAEHALELARSLPPQPAIADDNDAQLSEHYTNGRTHQSIRVMVATLLVAKRTGRAIYSDDRWIREFARSIGVASFGTLAVIDALAERSVIDDGARRKARIALASRHGWGVGLSGAEMVQAAGEKSFELTKPLIGALNDRATWRASASPYMQETLELLEAVFEARPDRLDVWLQRIVDGSATAIPEAPPGWSGHLLLAMAWVSNLSPEFFRAIVDAVKALPPHLRAPGADPVIEAMKLIVPMLEESVTGDDQRIAQFRALAQMLKSTDQYRVFRHFLR